MLLENCETEFVYLALKNRLKPCTLEAEIQPANTTEQRCCLRGEIPIASCFSVFNRLSWDDWPANPIACCPC